MQGRSRESKFRYPRPQQVVEFEHAALEPGQRTGLVAARCESSLHALAQPTVFVVDGYVDAVAQIPCRALLAERQRNPRRLLVGLDVAGNKPAHNAEKIRLSKQS